MARGWTGVDNDCRVMDHERVGEGAVIWFSWSRDGITTTCRIRADEAAALAFGFRRMAVVYSEVVKLLSW
jgi:hypothetical protein